MLSRGYSFQGQLGETTFQEIAKVSSDCHLLISAVARVLHIKALLSDEPPTDVEITHSLSQETMMGNPLYCVFYNPPYTQLAEIPEFDLPNTILKRGVHKMFTDKDADYMNKSAAFEAKKNNPDVVLYKIENLALYQEVCAYKTTLDDAKKKSELKEEEPEHETNQD